jgi:hypothetical protein
MVDAHKGTRDYLLKDLIITSPNGGKVSLIYKFVSCSIFENIFSNTMSCELSFLDVHNWARHLPIIGQQEKLEIVFSLAGADDVTFEFDVYGIRSKHVSTAGRSQVMVLSCVSPEMFKDSHTKISKSYYGTISDIVTEIYDSNIKDVSGKELSIDVKTTNVKKKYVIPNWSPFTAINWLTARAVAEDNTDACNFVFYEDREGFHFTTLDKLVDVPIPKQSYMWHPRKYRDLSKPSSVRGQRDVGYEHRNLESIRFADAGNRLEEIETGMYASKVLTHDIVRKKYEVTDFNLKDSWDGIKHVEKEYPIIKGIDKFSPESNTVYDFKPKHKFLNRKNKLHGGETVEDNDEYEKWFSKRKSQMKQIESMRLYTNGAGDSRRMCGDVVHLRFEPLEPGEAGDESNTDKYISGKYLVTSVRHFFQQDGGYQMDMELAKDSVQESYPESNTMKELGK